MTTELQPFQRSPIDLDPSKEKSLLDHLGQVTDAQGRADLLGQLGEYYRGAGKAAKAIECLKEALSLETELWKQFKQRLRLAIAYQYMGDGKRADDVFFDLANEPSVANWEQYHFFTQHYGKFLIECGEYRRAEPWLEVALALRSMMADEELRASSQRALDGLREKDFESMPLRPEGMTAPEPPESTGGCSHHSHH